MRKYIRGVSVVCLALLMLFATVSTASAYYKTIPLRIMSFDADGHKFSPIDCTTVNPESTIFLQGRIDGVRGRQMIRVTFTDPTDNIVNEVIAQTNYYGNVGTRFRVSANALLGDYTLKVETLPRCNSWYPTRCDYNGVSGTDVYSQDIVVTNAVGTMTTNQFSYYSRYHDRWITRIVYSRQCLA